MSISEDDIQKQALCGGGKHCPETNIAGKREIYHRIQVGTGYIQ